VYGVKLFTGKLFEPDRGAPTTDMNLFNLVNLTFCQKLMSLFGIAAQPGIQIHGFNLTSTLTVQNIRLILGTFAT
jgi:hypothetical protein